MSYNKELSELYSIISHKKAIKDLKESRKKEKFDVDILFLENL